MRDKKSDEISQRSRRWISITFESLGKCDIQALGPKVKAPTLLAYAEHDGLRRGEQQALEGIKGSVLKIVPDASNIHWSKPDEFVKLTLDFLLDRS